MTKFYLVGGCVRDKLLGIPCKDIDYAVEAQSFDEMRQAVIKREGQIFLENPQYLTIRAKIPKMGVVDFVACRKDGHYSDGRHPDSVQSGTIFDDLCRRDLTMNAIALDPDTGKIIDPYNGRKDIQNKILRFVGNPTERLNEDKLRAFRILRFHITKNFTISDDSYNALKQLEEKDFENVSTERIRQEITKMFCQNSSRSFILLYIEFPSIGNVITERGIWFKPTTEKARKDIQ